MPVLYKCPECGDSGELNYFPFNGWTCPKCGQHYDVVKAPTDPITQAGVSGEAVALAAAEPLHGKFLHWVHDKHQSVPRRVLWEAYEAGARAVAARSGWRSIESAPRDGTAILGWSAQAGVEIFWMQTGDDAEARRKNDQEPTWTTAVADCSNGEHGWYAEGAFHMPTCWMPLPDQPGVHEPPTQASELVEKLRIVLAADYSSLGPKTAFKRFREDIASLLPCEGMG